MIDLHCHILPGVDDGAGNIDDSVEMAAQADANGISIVCATPHIRHDHDVRVDELADRVDRLNDVLASRGCSVRVLTGGEVAETALDDLDDADLERVSLGGGGLWILLEPASGPLSDALVSAVDRLAERGHRAVVAHPERHVDQDFYRRLEALTSRGALIQVTAALLAEPVAHEGVLDMASAGALHLLGSDSHSARFGRPLALAAALERLAAVRLTAGHLEWIGSEAPTAIIAGRDVSPPFGMTPPRPRSAREQI